MVLWQAEVEFGMKVFSGMDAHLQTAIHKVVAHLQNALLHFGGVLGLQNVVFERFAIDLFGLFFVGQHQQGFVVTTEDVVDVDAYKNLYFGNIAQFATQLEVTRRTEEADHGQETVEVGHALGYALQFVKEGIAWSVIEEFGACAHNTDESIRQFPLSEHFF